MLEFSARWDGYGLLADVAAGVVQYISGAIMFDETLYQSTRDGTPFVDVLKSQDILPGIKVDTGLQ
eukprot:45751-Eustigmatos_ZCMA.PRE.1